jgi:hypothetical protein
MTVSTESLIKTVIVFKGGLISELMEREKAAANALAAFGALGLAMAEGRIRKVKLDLENLHIKTLLKAFGQWNDETTSAVDEVAGMTERKQGALVTAFTMIAEKVIDEDALPVDNGRQGVQQIWDQIKQGE